MATTLVVGGVCEGDLEETVARYKSPLIALPSVLRNTTQFGNFGLRPHPHIIQVSRAIDGRITPLGYNSLLTVTSDSAAGNLQVVGQFELDTGIAYDVGLSAELVKHYQAANALFDLLKTDFKAAAELYQRLSARV